MSAGGEDSGPRGALRMDPDRWGGQLSPLGPISAAWLLPGRWVSLGSGFILLVWPRGAWEPRAEAQPCLHTQVGSWHLLGDSGADEGNLAERAGISLCTCKCLDLLQGGVLVVWSGPGFAHVSVQT